MQCVNNYLDLLHVELFWIETMMYFHDVFYFFFFCHVIQFLGIENMHFDIEIVQIMTIKHHRRQEHVADWVMQGTMVPAVKFLKKYSLSVAPFTNMV